MGKLSAIIVIGFAVIVGIIGVTMSKRAHDSQKNSVSFYEKAQARNISKSATQMFMRELRKNPDLTGTFGLDILGGSADVTVQEKTRGKRDSLRLHTVARYGTASHKVDLDATMGDDSAPRVTGALGVSYLSKAKLNFGKGTNIDGRSHNIAGDLDNAYADIAGLSLGHPEQLLNLEYKPKDVKIKGKGIVEPNIEVQTPQPDYYKWALRLAEGADVVYNGRDVKTVETLGSISHPQVTYIRGKTKFNENVTGAGILIVDGSCKFNKYFEFVGLVFVVGDSLSSEKASLGKGSKIIGAMMVAGKKTHVKTGDVDILYSRQAVNSAIGLVESHMSRKYVYANWRE